MSFRAKLLAIVGIAAVAFVAVTAASSVISNRVVAELRTIEDVYVPRVELGPRIEALLTRLARRFQDAVGAHDLDLLANTRETRDALLAALARAGDAIAPDKADAVRRAIAAYYTTAEDVSRRLITGEIGEPIVAAMATMQTRQKAAADAIMAATLVDRATLSAAFSAATDAERTAARVRLGLSLGFLALALGFSLVLARSVLRSLRGLTDGFRRFGQGEFNAPIPTRGGDELALVARQANLMAQNLGRVAADRAHADWLKAGVAQLSEELRGELAPREVGARALRFLARYLEAPAAALYYSDGPPELTLLSHQGLDDRVDGLLPQRFSVGEGLVGATAQQRDLRVVGSPPAGYLRVRSALGEAEPTAIVLLPLVYAERVSGVVELALFKPWSEATGELLRLVREALAIALHVAHRRSETQALLTETQAQARRLVDQDQELRATNEELSLQQEELREINAELSQQTAVLEAQRQELEERHAALDETRAQLEHQASELASVSNYKSQFLTNMSHELRTPLNSMLLLSNLLADNEDGNLTAKQVEYCQAIHSAGRDLLGLINQVLDLAQVESGRPAIRMAPVRLADLADHARRVFEPQARHEGLALRVELAPDVPEEIITDQQRVDQVLTNLLGNAIKFTPSGEVGLRIARPAPDTRFARADLAAGGVVMLAVSDTGPGIPADQHERIFAPFEQLDPRPDRRYGGTGLGLALAHELVGLLGGELRLESEAGRGSTFTCYLPIAGAATAAHDGASPRTSGAADNGATSPRPTPRAALSRARADERAAPEAAPGDAAQDPGILVIEDDDVFAAALGEVIRAAGLPWRRAVDGQSGVAMARARPPRAIVLDVRLPDGDGFDVMRTLRAEPATQNVPVHFASAVDATDRGLAMGAIGYLVKPATRDELKAMVGALAGARDRVRVLVVEDDSVTGALLAKPLRADGMEVVHATTAEAARAAVAARRFDCMILDLGLPDMDGLELLERLHEEHDDPPAVLIATARSLTREETRRLEQYAEAVVLKDGAAADRVLNEVRLFARRIRAGLDPRRARQLAMQHSELRLDGRRILVVDDDMRTVYALSAALRSKGVEVLVADTGHAALAVLDAHPEVDGVLMDIMMPEMDGYEAMRRIRAQARFAGLLIIALTAKAMRGDAAKCVAAGASDYLPKPIEADRLLALLAQHLGGDADARQGPADAGGEHDT